MTTAKPAASGARTHPTITSTSHMSANASSSSAKVSRRRPASTAARSCSGSPAVPRATPALNAGSRSIAGTGPSTPEHHKLDWNYDEDRIRTGRGPENITRLRRFALGVLKPFPKPGQSIAAMMHRLGRRSRPVMDYLRLTSNSHATVMA